MKKLIKINLLFLMILLSACSNNKTNNIPNTNNNGNTNNNEPAALTIKDFFPNTENTKYDYEGQGNEYASYTVFTDYINENKVQTRTNNGGTEVVKVIENKDGKLTELYSRPETYFRENFTTKTFKDGNIILKEPLTKGNSWSLSDGSKRSITGTDTEITTPMGTYKTLEVTTERKDSKNIDYYAKDIGLIKSVSTGTDYEVSSTLKKIDKNVSFVQSINVYYPNLDGDTLYIVAKELSFNTNDVTKEKFEDAVKNNGKQNDIFSTNVKINSLYLNDDGMVYIDFSKELISEMNAGSLYEGMILQSITNTVGMYYGVEKVYITVEGKPYESGHFKMNEGEPFIVNLEKSKLAE